MFLSRQFDRAPGGGYRLRLAPGERFLLRELLDELEELLRDPDDPGLQRLFPPAHDEQEDEESYRGLVGDSLVAGRRESLSTVRATLDRKQLSADEAESWLRTLNDLRLVLGTRLDVTEDLDYDELRPDDERGRGLAIYAYLSWLQEQVVEAMADR